MAIPSDHIIANFVQPYYTKFAADRAGFVNEYYRTDSTFTFESNTAQGVDAIRAQWSVEHLQTAKLQITTVNAQQSVDGSIIVLVTGLMQLTETDAPMNFAHSMLLKTDAEQKPYCFNDMFKLVYG
ncbi:Uu.00g121990.m01.CDS01 [Anthostomella pinea]|uniref:Nuclear transport factor 2 n=1 Tax=Anthostomella pinea TaxID=933095 RepID=A0AAI8VH43_9PEZI|nr:Uu.00g121990.m01.CDS01 [Anthostomella pinea]